MEIELIDIDKLKPNDEWNPRQIKDDKFKTGCDIMAKRGWLENMVVNNHESAVNVIISGNQRYRIAQYLRSQGYKNFDQVPVKWVSFDFDDPDQLREAQKISVELNNKFGEWDYDILTSFSFTPSDFADAAFNMDELGRNLDVDFQTIDWETGELLTGEIVLDEEEIQIRPFSQTHILLSFPPETLINIQDNLDKILKNKDVEYEQSSN